MENQRCLQITEELAKEYGGLFAFPVDPERDGLPEYFDIVKQPMCFQDIEQKINQNQYGDKSEWFKDICLVYENCMLYHKDRATRYLYVVANFALWKFKRRTKLFVIKDETEWMDKIISRTNRITELMSKVPVNSRETSDVRRCVRKGDEEKGTVTSADITNFVERINTAVNDSEVREDLFDILKETANMSIEEAAAGPIDAERLPIQAKKALLEYARIKRI